VLTAAVPHAAVRVVRAVRDRRLRTPGPFRVASGSGYCERIRVVRRVSADEPAYWIYGTDPNNRDRAGEGCSWLGLAGESRRWLLLPPTSSKERVMTPVLWLALTVAAPGLKDKPASPVLEGEWQAQARTYNGKPAPYDPPTVRYVFGPGDRWVMFLEGKEIDEEKRSFEVIKDSRPLAINLTIGMPAEGPTFRGIYKIEKDTLTICMRHGSEERPTEFKSEEGSRTYLYVFGRVKK
jgi:uncharacterized protein (TIGR03067 family)